MHFVVSLTPEATCHYFFISFPDLRLNGNKSLEPKSKIWWKELNQVIGGCYWIPANNRLWFLYSKITCGCVFECNIFKTTKIQKIILNATMIQLSVYYIQCFYKSIKNINLNMFKNKNISLNAKHKLKTSVWLKLFVLCSDDGIKGLQSTSLHCANLTQWLVFNVFNLLYVFKESVYTIMYLHLSDFISQNHKDMEAFECCVRYKHFCLQVLLDSELVHMKHPEAFSC